MIIRIIIVVLKAYTSTRKPHLIQAGMNGLLGFSVHLRSFIETNDLIRMVNEEMVLKQLKTVIDPELNVDIVDLGLIYNISIDQKKGEVEIDMTLTSPGCPLAFVFEQMVRDAVSKIKGVRKVFVNLVFEPAWNPDKMSEEVREKLGIL